MTLLAGQRIHCRIAGIDAPELAWHGKWADQPGAYESHEALDNLIMGQTVDVQDTSQRSYERMVCRLTVSVDGHPVDVSEYMVGQGWAWSAIQFEPVRDRDMNIPVLQSKAQAAKVGIWANEAVPPWDWRHHGK